MKRKTPKQKAIARLVEACSTASKRDKKVNKGINYCNITYESLYNLMEVQQWKCAETNIPFLILERKMKVDETNALGLNRLNLPSVDRIDNNKGYTMDNIKIVSLGYNNLKNRYDEVYVREWINAIKSDNNDKVY
jgi:hypothetical protein